MRISRSFRSKTTIEGVGRKEMQGKTVPQKTTGRHVLKRMERHRENKKKWGLLNSRKMFSLVIQASNSVAGSR